MCTYFLKFGIYSSIELTFKENLKRKEFRLFISLLVFVSTFLDGHLTSTRSIHLCQGVSTSIESTSSVCIPWFAEKFPGEWLFKRLTVKDWLNKNIILGTFWVNKNSSDSRIIFWLYSGFCLSLKYDFLE